MDQLNAMRTYVAVATLGSFAEAARRTRQSPSAVTRSVAQLEDRLGLTLLARTTRSVTLTERGQIYLDRCRRLLDDLEQVEREVRGEDAAPRGLLTVTAPILFGRLHVVPIIGQLLADHADLSIRLILSDRNSHLIDDGVDVAVRIGDLEDSSLVAARLGQVTRVVVASPAYIASHGLPRTPADIAAHHVIAFEGIDAINEWRFGGGIAPVRLHPRLSVNSADAAIAAAEQGVGITRALSYQVSDAIQSGRLTPVLSDFAPAALAVSALYPARRSASPNVAAFVKAARARIGVPSGLSDL